MAIATWSPLRQGLGNWLNGISQTFVRAWANVRCWGGVDVLGREVSIDDWDKQGQGITTGGLSVFIWTAMEIWRWFVGGWRWIRGVAEGKLSWWVYFRNSKNLLKITLISPEHILPFNSVLKNPRSQNVFLINFKYNNNNLTEIIFVLLSFNKVLLFLFIYLLILFFFTSKKISENTTPFSFNIATPILLSLHSQLRSQSPSDPLLRIPHCSL
jgi:hypothetical protein